MKNRDQDIPDIRRASEVIVIPCKTAFVLVLKV
jgi:hypothetical protein